MSGTPATLRRTPSSARTWTRYRPTGKKVLRRAQRQVDATERAWRSVEDTPNRVDVLGSDEAVEVHAAVVVDSPGGAIEREEDISVPLGVGVLDGDVVDADLELEVLLAPPAIVDDVHAADALLAVDNEAMAVVGAEGDLIGAGLGDEDSASDVRAQPIVVRRIGNRPAAGNTGFELLEVAEVEHQRDSVLRQILIRNMLFAGYRYSKTGAPVSASVRNAS